VSVVGQKVPPRDRLGGGCLLLIHRQ
jgi:hypothetical protein